MGLETSQERVLDRVKHDRSECSLPDAVLADLDRGDLNGARRRAHWAKRVPEKLAAQARSAHGFRLNNLQTDVAWTLRNKAERLARAEQVFAVIEEITPIP